MGPETRTFAWIYPVMISNIQDVFYFDSSIKDATSRFNPFVTDVDASSTLRKLL
jgi:hypothetical protein